MRSLTIDEHTAVVGGDDDGNATACQTAVGAATWVVGATYGLPAGAAAASVGSAATSTCEVITTAAGQAIAAGVAGASEGISESTDSLFYALGAFQMAAKRAGVNWLNVDGL